MSPPAKAALQGTDDGVLQALGERLAEAVAVIADVSGELGDFLSNCPATPALWKASSPGRASCAV